ncbi:sporulation protein [Kitasatospora sp. NPDC059327]|uniref:sporulation protein n=1 Tax=Kitasatospora sp. NPDC059327 TaxID=3346803 RepID=UPI00368C864F
MATTRAKGPNTALAELVEAAGASHKWLAKRVNELAAERGVTTAYTHTGVSRWTTKGMVPRDPTPACVAVALGERLGRPVTLAEIGMGEAREAAPDIGLDFPRDPDTALRGAIQHWSTPMLNRRALLNTFAIGAYTVPTVRWLGRPADTEAVTPDPYGRRVGRTDLDQLWEASEEARRWDSRFGGGNAKAPAVSRLLSERAVPLLQGQFTERLGRELLTAVSELARVSAWSAFDMGDHGAAQRDFVQSLRLARAAGDTEAGAYTLATMSLQAMLRGYPEEAIDMAQGAYDRAHRTAAPRVLAFVKLAEARAHGRAGDSRAAGRALVACENLLDSIHPGTRDPAHLAYLTHQRISTDAAEIHKDLGQPEAALRWGRQAGPMSATDFARATGIRCTVLAVAHLQHDDLPSALAAGERAAAILGPVRSARAHGYLRDVTTALRPWRGQDQVDDFLRRAGKVLATA